MKRLALIGAVIVMRLMSAHTAFGHGPEMLLGSTAKGSGALALAYDFTDKTVAGETATLGSVVLYTSLFPGVEWLQADDPTDGLYTLIVGTPFSMEIVSIDYDVKVQQGVSVMIGSKTLNAAGQSAFVANTTNVAGDHFHPQWQLLLPTGVTGTYAVSFQLTTTSKTYTKSPVYTLFVTNVVDATPTATATVALTGTPTASPSSSSTPTESAPRDTPTPTASETASSTPTSTDSPTPSATPTPTATPTVPALRGDANCDGRVNAADLPAEIELLGPGAPVVCGADLNDDGMVDEQDLSALIDVLFQP